MSQLQLIGTYNIPTYALSYLINGDSSGLNDPEVRIIDDWLILLDHESITYSCSDNSDFFHQPAFGLACDCAITKVYGHARTLVKFSTPKTDYENNACSVCGEIHREKPAENLCSNCGHDLDYSRKLK